MSDQRITPPKWPPPWDPDCGSCTSPYEGVECKYHAPRTPSPSPDMDQQAAERIWTSRISPTLAGKFTINRGGIIHEMVQAMRSARADERRICAQQVSDEAGRLLMGHPSDEQCPFVNQHDEHKLSCPISIQRPGEGPFDCTCSKTSGHQAATDAELIHRLHRSGTIDDEERDRLMRERRTSDAKDIEIEGKSGPLLCVMVDKAKFRQFEQWLLTPHPKDKP